MSIGSIHGFRKLNFLETFPFLLMLYLLSVVYSRLIHMHQIEEHQFAQRGFAANAVPHGLQNGRTINLSTKSHQCYLSLVTQILYQLWSRAGLCSPISHYLSCLTFPSYQRSTGMTGSSYKRHWIEWQLTAEQWIKVNVPITCPERHNSTTPKETARYAYSTRSAVSLSSVALPRWLAPENQQNCRILIYSNVLCFYYARCNLSISRASVRDNTSYRVSSMPHKVSTKPHFTVGSGNPNLLNSRMRVFILRKIFEEKEIALSLAL